MVRIKYMKKIIIKSMNDEVVEARIVLDDMTVEEAREFLKKIGEMLDENETN